MESIYQKERSLARQALNRSLSLLVIRLTVLLERSFSPKASPKGACMSLVERPRTYISMTGLARAGDLPLKL